MVNEMKPKDPCASTIASDFRHAVARKPRLFIACVSCMTVIAVLAAIEASTGVLNSPLAPRTVESARITLYGKGNAELLPTVLSIAEEIPDLTIYDAIQGIVSGGEANGKALISYYQDIDGQLRLVCTGPDSEEILSRILTKLASRISLPVKDGYKSQIVLAKAKDAKLSPVWILLLIPLGPLGFAALSAFLDLVTRHHDREASINERSPIDGEDL